MDKVESVKAVNIFDEQVGTSLNLNVVSIWDEVQNKWKTIGTGEFGSTRDGKHWGAIKAEAMAIDDDLMNAIAVVMRSLNNVAISSEFSSVMLDAVESAEKADADETNRIEEGQS